MTAVGGLTGAGSDSAARLTRALSSGGLRPGEVSVCQANRVAVGAIATHASASTGFNGIWAVAVAGIIDTVDGVATADPVAALVASLTSRGPSALTGLSGEFAGVATDGLRLIGFRDHLGSTPLFHGCNGSQAVVATEPKQVLSGLGRSRRPDIDGLVSVYFSQWEPPDDVPSVVEGVDRVPRRAIVDITASGTRRIGWTWDPVGLVETSLLNTDEAIEAGWSIIQGTVDRVTTSNSAVSLSGGIDSTLIATAAACGFRTRTGTPMRAITATYPHAPSVDESEYVELTRAALGLDLVSFASSRDRLAELELWVDRFDGPIHGLAIGPMAEMNDVAAKHGITTLLGGEMAELVYDLREFATTRIMWRRRLPTALEHLRHMHSIGMPYPALARMVANGFAPSGLALSYQRRFRAPPEIPAWLDATAMPGLGRHWALEQPARHRWPRIQEFFATGPSYPGLELASIMGNVAGVTTRRPLASREVWEFFLSLPPEVKFPDGWTKSIVRRMLDGRAPDEVVWRTDKTVFDADTKHRAGYEDLRLWIDDRFRLPGVDYVELRTRLANEDLTTWELSMARTLASIHVFVGLCS